jgi:hypothetical protein
MFKFFYEFSDWIIDEERINEDVEDKMFGNGMMRRPFSFGEGIRGMRQGEASMASSSTPPTSLSTSRL